MRAVDERSSRAPDSPRGRPPPAASVVHCRHAYLRVLCDRCEVHSRSWCATRTSRAARMRHERRRRLLSLPVLTSANSRAAHKACRSCAGSSCPPATDDQIVASWTGSPRREPAEVQLAATRPRRVARATRTATSCSSRGRATTKTAGPAVSSAQAASCWSSFWARIGLTASRSTRPTCSRAGATIATPARGDRRLQPTLPRSSSSRARRLHPGNSPPSSVGSRLGSPRARIPSAPASAVPTYLYPIFHPPPLCTAACSRRSSRFSAAARVLAMPLDDPTRPRLEARDEPFAESGRAPGARTARRLCADAMCRRPRAFGAVRPAARLF